MLNLFSAGCSEYNSTMIIDTHAHLTWNSFNHDREAVIQRAKDAGITTIINIGADLKSSEAALQLAQDEQQDGVSFYSTIGLHPNEVSRLISVESIHDYTTKLEQVYQSEPSLIVAVGECGLDYYFEGNEDFTPPTLSVEQLKSRQMILFKDQIALAKKLNLPLVVHNRDAWEDIIIPELNGVVGVFHSFRGSEEQARQVLDLGFYLGITCVVTYHKNDSLRQIIKQAPLDRLLSETDCPFLPPQAHRGERNEPFYVTEVIKTIAEVKGLSFIEVAKTTSTNAQKLFRLR